ncbi:MAG: proton-conducting transporter membrane subunit [Candidatus Omnitrophica bacterium]|nr:proton-conducting transporter membrane subunit [Candidatus Omnitrophota bacterium]
MYQPNLKRMLAYSSISHSGYMLLAVVAFSPMSNNALLLYTLSYSIATITAFGILILIREAHGNDFFTSMNGMAKTNPLEAFCLTVAMLSLTGIPPLAGFWSKLIIIVALWMSGLYFYAFVAVAGSVLTLAYFLSLQRKVFFGKLGEGLSGVKEAGFGLAFPAVLLALLTVGAGLFLPVILRVFILPVSAIVGG